MKKLIDLIRRFRRLVEKKPVQENQKAGKTNFQHSFSPGTRPVIDGGRVTGRI